MIDGHVHLEYGPLTIEYVQQFVDEAKRKGITHLQILDHTHRFIEFKKMYQSARELDIQDKWYESKFKDSLKDYVQLIEKAKKIDFGIEVTYGLEVCYTENYESYIRDVLKEYHFDFLVGSIHSIFDRLYDMSFSKEYLWDIYDTDMIYKRYYECVKHLIESDLFTQLGHIDTIKMFNYYPSYDLTSTYEEIAQLLNKHHMKAECNVGCYYRYNHPDLGLSDELLKCFKSFNVELITASDAHYPYDVGTCIKEAVDRIEKV